jgi:transcriptional regulator with XRE-family HTH domain
VCGRSHSVLRSCGSAPPTLLGSCSSSRCFHGVACPFTNLAFQAAKPLPESYPAELKTVCDHLRKERLDRGLLQREVAEALSVRLPTYQAWEQGHEPTVRHWPAIIAWLGYYPFPEPVTPAEKLVAYRREHGLSQAELAEKLGVDGGSITRWERDGVVQKMRDRRAVAELLEWTATEQALRWRFRDR